MLLDVRSLYLDVGCFMLLSVVWYWLLLLLVLVCCLLASVVCLFVGCSYSLCDFCLLVEVRCLLFVDVNRLQFCAVLIVV